MITNDQLLKLFVLVPSTVENFNGATVSGAANEHRLFFEENTGLIWAKGKSFGGNDSELEAIVNGLIGSDTNKSIREIAGAVLSEAMNLADDANTTIDNLTEVLNWFKNLPEDEAGALALINKLGDPAVLYTAEDEAQNSEHVEGTVKTPATGVFALIDALKTRVSTAEGKITALETTVGDSTSGLVKDVNDLKTTVGDANSGLVKSVADINTSIGNLNTRVTALEEFDPWENYVAPSQDPKPEP